MRDIFGNHRDVHVSDEDFSDPLPAGPCYLAVAPLRGRILVTPCRNPTLAVGDGRLSLGSTAVEGNHRVMVEVTVVYWRDIPAQVIVGKGRRGSKVQLTERFEQAIDRCAMKVGARDTDSYLAEWRKAQVAEIEGEPDTIAADYAAMLEAEFDTARLKVLIEADGWSKA
jgi:Virulence factor